MIKRKILIISRIIIPAQNPRAYRATELAKELARHGHEVILYAVLGNYDYSDFEKKNKLKVSNIGKMMFSTYNSDEKIRNNLFDKISNKLFNKIIEFPDLELMFRIPRIIRLEKNVDLLVSIAAPYTIHWGCALSKSINKKAFPKTWLADCGDPFMGNSFQKPLFYFKYIEKWFCRKTDYIAVPFEGAKEGYYKEFRNKIRVIPQGFNFDGLKLCPTKPINNIPTFAFAGAFYKGIRDPSTFLGFLTTTNMDFRFIVYTKNVDLLNPYLKQLGKKLEIRDYVPHEVLIYDLSKMDFVINFENNTNIHSPSKLIDYAMAKRPILNIPANILPTVTFFEFLNGDYHDQYIVHNVEQYNIKNVARQFTSLLD